MLHYERTGMKTEMQAAAMANNAHGCCPNSGLRNIQQHL